MVSQNKDKYRSFILRKMPSENENAEIYIFYEGLLAMFMWLTEKKGHYDMLYQLQRT